MFPYLEEGRIRRMTHIQQQLRQVCEGSDKYAGGRGLELRRMQGDAAQDNDWVCGYRVCVAANLVLEGIAVEEVDLILRDDGELQRRGDLRFAARARRLVSTIMGSTFHRHAAGELRLQVGASDGSAQAGSIGQDRA